MSDSIRRTWADTAAAVVDGTQGEASHGGNSLQGDENENFEDCGEGQGLQPAARSPSDEQVVGDGQEEAALRSEKECCAGAPEEPRIHESLGNLRHITVFVDLSVAFTPAKVCRAIAFVIRPLTVLLWLMANRQWRSSVSLLSELEVPVLTLIACLADVSMTVSTEGATENVRKATESTAFVLLVLLKLLFSVGQFSWCKRVAKMIWSRFLTPVPVDVFLYSECHVCPARTLPDLYGSNTSSSSPWGHKPSGCPRDHLFGACARISEALAGQQQNQPQVLHKYGAPTQAFLLENAFAAFVWMCALYVAVLVTITLFEMFLDAVTDVFTLYATYKGHRHTEATTRGDAFYAAVQKCLRDRQCTLLDRTKWYLIQLTSSNRENGAAIEPTPHNEDE